MSTSCSARRVDRYLSHGKGATAKLPPLLLARSLKPARPCGKTRMPVIAGKGK
jgi:hypothetical protein